MISIVDKCLENLQVEYIDLMLIHAPGLQQSNSGSVYLGAWVIAQIAAIKDLDEARIEIWEALQFCQKEGKIKHIGVSNFTRYHIEQLIKNPR